MRRLALSALLAMVVTGPVAAGTSLPFVEDDYARALNEARARKVPLFIEAWAPW